MKKIISAFICVSLAFAVFGCSDDSGKKQAEVSGHVTETSREETSAAEPETSETETTTSETEETVETKVINVSSEEYLADYPLFSEDKTVYVRCVPGFDFYADETDPFYETNYYEEYVDGKMVRLVLFSGPDAVDGFPGTDPNIQIYLNSSYGVDRFINEAETGWGDAGNHFEVGVPEVCANGITIYEINVHNDAGLEDGDQTIYMLEYHYNDKNLITISLYYFVPNGNIEGYEEGLEAVLNFYRTVEDPFLVVDKGTTVNFEM